MDEDAVHLALRARAYGLSVRTTGVTDLAQTATGFTRSAGSFETDGFLVGMEITPSGFPSNVVGSVYSVTPGEIKVTGVRAVVAEAPGRSLTVGLPGMQSWEGIKITPVTGTHYLVEEFAPGPSNRRSGNVSGGMMHDIGDYYITWYMPLSVQNVPSIGSKALRKCVSALKDRYTAGLSLPAGTDFVNIQSKPAPSTGQIVPLNGWLALQLKVPWQVFWTNGTT